MPPIILLSSFIFFMSGCFESETRNLHGLKSISTSEFGYRGAVDRSIDLKFDSKKSDISTISVVAKIPESYSGALSYKWTLGSDIKIDQGELSGTVSAKDNKKIFLRIFVKNFNSKEVKHVKFEITGGDSGRRIFADGIVSNNKENSFEEIVKEIETYKKENNTK
jgi:hypothetical protein